MATGTIAIAGGRTPSAQYQVNAAAFWMVCAVCVVLRMCCVLYNFVHCTCSMCCGGLHVQVRVVCVTLHVVYALSDTSCSCYMRCMRCSWCMHCIHRIYVRIYVLACIVYTACVVCALYLFRPASHIISSSSLVYAWPKPKGIWTSRATRSLRRKDSKTSRHRLLERSYNCCKAKATETTSRRFA